LVIEFEDVLDAETVETLVPDTVAVDDAEVKADGE